MTSNCRSEKNNFFISGSIAACHLSFLTILTLGHIMHNSGINNVILSMNNLENIFLGPVISAQRPEMTIVKIQLFYRSSNSYM